MLDLLTSSSYLKAAALDAREYYAEIEPEFKAKRYSQHAAAFLLTLMPNIEILRLPKQWKPNDATGKLIGAVVRRARQQSNLPYDRPSLAQVTKFGPSISLGPGERCDLDWASPFLALPHLRSFRGPSCVATPSSSSSSGQEHITLSDNSPQAAILAFNALEAVHLVSCCIDPINITTFLTDAPRLRTLRYSHCTKQGATPAWDICAFITAIERTVGAHLEELSVSIRELRGGEIAPGRASMRGFQRLRKLEFPLEVAACNVVAAAASSGALGSSSMRLDHDGLDGARAASLLADLVPASIVRLSLLSSGEGEHAEALEELFRGFGAKKDGVMPKLEEIRLSCPVEAGDGYTRVCERVRKESEGAGVVCYLKRHESSTRLTWDGEE